MVYLLIIHGTFWRSTMDPILQAPMLPSSLKRRDHDGVGQLTGNPFGHLSQAHVLMLHVVLLTIVLRTLYRSQLKSSGGLVTSVGPNHASTASNTRLKAEPRCHWQRAGFGPGYRASFSDWAETLQRQWPPSKSFSYLAGSLFYHTEVEQVFLRWHVEF